MFFSSKAVIKKHMLAQMFHQLQPSLMMSFPRTARQGISTLIKSFTSTGHGPTRSPAAHKFLDVLPLKRKPAAPHIPLEAQLKCCPNPTWLAQRRPRGCQFMPLRTAQGRRGCQQGKQVKQNAVHPGHLGKACRVKPQLSREHAGKAFLRAGLSELGLEGCVGVFHSKHSRRV